MKGKLNGVWEASYFRHIPFNQLTDSHLINILLGISSGKLQGARINEIDFLELQQEAARRGLSWMGKDPIPFNVAEDYLHSNSSPDSTTDGVRMHSASIGLLKAGTQFYWCGDKYTMTGVFINTGEKRFYSAFQSRNGKHIHVHEDEVVSVVRELRPAPKVHSVSDVKPGGLFFYHGDKYMKTAADDLSNVTRTVVRVSDGVIRHIHRNNSVRLA